jgi:hypothetical protein
MEKFTRNVDSYKEKNAISIGQMRVLDVTPEQQELTSELILPYKEDIIADSVALRADIDATIPKHRQETYPIGYCNEIRNAFLNHLYGASLDRSRIGFRAIHEFNRRGGVVSPFWAIYQQKYFQNAIQIGGALLDVAQDTLDGKGKVIAFYDDIEQSPFTPIDSYDEYAAVAEQYWHDKVYPNIYFPELAPMFPVLVVKSQSLQHAGINRTMHALYLSDQGAVSNVGLHDLSKAEKTDFYNQRLPLAKKFLTEGAYSKKRLPVGFLEQALRLRPELKKFSPTYDEDKVNAVFDRYTLWLRNSEQFSNGSMHELNTKQFDELLTLLDVGSDFTNTPLCVFDEATYNKMK